MNNKGADQTVQTGLCLCCSQTLKTGFLPSRPIYHAIFDARAKEILFYLQFNQLTYNSIYLQFNLLTVQFTYSSIYLQFNLLTVQFTYSSIY